MFRGSVIALILVLLLATWSLFDFEHMFLLFHTVSFSNPFWMLDPSRDYLIMLFPGKFFFDAALFGFIAVIAECVVIGGITFSIVRLKR